MAAQFVVSLARWILVVGLLCLATAAAHVPVVQDNPARHHQEASR